MYSAAQAFLIVRGIGRRRWSGWTPLTKRQIAAQGVHTSCGQLLRQCHQQRSCAVSSCPVSEYQASDTGSGSTMKKTADWFVTCREIREGFCPWIRHA